MTPPTDDMDMEFDPEDGDEDETSADHTGGAMLTIGAFLLGIFLLWDFFGSEPPSAGTYAVLGVWLMLGACVAIVEVVYR